MTSHHLVKGTLLLKQPQNILSIKGYTTMQPVNRATDSSPRSVTEHPTIQNEPRIRGGLPLNIPRNAMALNFPEALALQPRAAANPFRNTRGETGTAAGASAAAPNPPAAENQPAQFPFLPRF